MSARDAIIEPMPVRPATAADVDAIVPMIAKTCAFHQAANPRKYPFLPHPERGYGNWLRRCAGDPSCVFLVGTHSGEVVAFLIATIEDEIPIYRIKRYGFIQDLWVEEAYRRHGLAKELLAETVRRFADMQINQVRLDVLEHNEPARQLFASCGFRTSIVEMIHEV